VRAGLYKDEIHGVERGVALQAVTMFSRNRVFTPSRLLGMSIVFLLVAIFVGSQSCDLDQGLPRQSALRAISGPLASLRDRQGPEIQLAGHAEKFRLPRSTRPSRQLEAALGRAAKDRSQRVELRYSPKPALAFSGEKHLLFYELLIDGRVVHSYAETRRDWHAVREVGRALAQVCGAFGIAFLLMALRMARAARAGSAGVAPG
jgi:hypothetical protein